MIGAALVSSAEVRSPFQKYLFCLPLILDALCEVLINLQGFQYEFPNFFTLLDLYFFDGREKFPV
jgi:hypothetical protein